MIGNIMILGIAVSILVYAKKVFWSDLAKNSFCLWSAIGLCAIFIFSIILPNIELVKSPFNPEINGKVIDEITKKPILGASVIVDWGYSYGEFPMHSSVASLKQQVITTDASGEFKAARRLRCLAINLFPLYSRDSGGVGIMILHPDYKYGSDTEVVNNMQIVKMTRYSNVDELVKDNYNLKILSESESRRGLRSTAEAIDKIISDKNKLIRLSHGHLEGNK